MGMKLHDKEGNRYRFKMKSDDAFTYALKDALLSRRNFLKAAAAAAAPAITGGFGFFSHARSESGSSDAHADLIVTNSKVATMAQGKGFSQALAIRGNKFFAVGDNQEIMQMRGPKTTVIHANNRTIIPGLNDSHTHVIRGGLNYNMELRWDGVPSLSLALEIRL